MNQVIVYTIPFLPALTFCRYIDPVTGFFRWYFRSSRTGDVTQFKADRDI